MTKRAASRCSMQSERPTLSVSSIHAMTGRSASRRLWFGRDLEMVSAVSSNGSFLGTAHPAPRVAGSSPWPLRPAFLEERFETGFFARQVDVHNPFDPTILVRGENLLAGITMDFRTQAKMVKESYSR